MEHNHSLTAIFILLQILLVLPALAAYSPPGFALDMWFIKEKGVWQQFELNGPHPTEWDKPWPPLNQPGRPALKWFEQGIFHSTSTDLITWKDVGVALTIGKPGDWDDGKIASGNMVKHGDTYYMFYPGIREHPRPGECATPIGLATSKDLIHWTKCGDKPILVPDGKHYDPAGNWRDCNFLWDAASRTWYTVICATAAGSGSIESRACIALAKSTDLIKWTYLPPLYVTDHYNLGLELPFIFKHGSKWYLGHSMYSNWYNKDWLAKHPEVKPEGGVYYLVGDNMFGPYEYRDDYRLGCQVDPCPYAVQLIDHSGEKLFMHWGPQRYATALPKKVEFFADGRMRLVYWKGVEVARKESLLGSTPKTFSLTADLVKIGSPVTDCFLEAEITMSKGSRVGLALGESLLVCVDADTGVVDLLDPRTREPKPGRSGKAASGNNAKLKIIADGSVVEVYADDVWLFAEMCPRPNPDQAAILALRGSAKIKNLRLDKLVTGNKIHHYGFNY